MKKILKKCLPPLVTDAYRFIKKKLKTAPAEWEYVSNVWPAAGIHASVKGWNVQEVLDTYKRKFDLFEERLKEVSPLGFSPEFVSKGSNNLVLHNTNMCFAYVLALSARGNSSLKVLDWGGGIGQYYALSRALLPQIDIEYHCKEVPFLAEYGRQLFKNAHFFADETCFENSYDLIFASGSLHYSEDWPSLLVKFAKASSKYVYITRLPVLPTHPSFTVVQRAYAHGYNTEYIGWFINRAEWLKSAEAAGLKLVREFYIGENPVVHRAPEQCEYRGYLFRKG
jgi:putative methyltransferase (TIGR04325 family)